MSRLADRLARLRESGGAPGQRSPGQRSPAARQDREPSSTAERGTAEARHRRASAPAVGNITPPGPHWVRIADFLWERSLHRAPLLPESFPSGFILPETTRTEDLLFYDLETTGLSGGAGNVAFLIGLGRQEREVFTVTQLFLADYPGEAAMLKRFGDLASPAAYHVSYNGRSFDSQVLKTRFLINRLAPLDSPQADLLYPARRLWRGVLPDLSLKTLESGVLGKSRLDDLPGSEAPDAWLEWLQGRPGRIEGVFRHNADDIGGLALVLGRLEDWGGLDVRDREAPRPPGAVPSFRGMARQWADAGGEKELHWLETGWKAGDTGCGWELAGRMKRRSDYRGACAIWERIDSPAGRDYWAAVELAKYLEHRQKAPGKALERLEGLDGGGIPLRLRQDLEYRRTRLRRKLAGG